jgi:hypothetical protein
MFAYLAYRVDLLTAAAIGVPVVLILIGITSILPLAEYAYIRQDYINPAIARDSQRAYKEWKREKRQTGFDDSDQRNYCSHFQSVEHSRGRTFAIPTE